MCLLNVIELIELECALEKHSSFNTNAQKIIAKLNEICLNNVATQYGDQLHTQKDGIVTGDNHSVSLAKHCCTFHPTAYCWSAT